MSLSSSLSPPASLPLPLLSSAVPLLLLSPFLTPKQLGNRTQILTLTSERVSSNTTGSKQEPLRGGCKMLSSSNTPLRSFRNPETYPFVMNSFSTSGQNLHCSDPVFSKQTKKIDSTNYFTQITEIKRRKPWESRGKNLYFFLFTICCASSHG